MKKILLMLCCCAVTAAFAVEWNMADVSIVMPKKVTPNLERAKKELEFHLNFIGGKVVENGKYKMHIGVRPKGAPKNARFQAVCFIKGNDIYFYGDESRRRPQQCGSLMAIYTFFRKYYDMRYLRPGDEWITCKKGAKITLPDNETITFKTKLELISLRVYGTDRIVNNNGFAPKELQTPLAKAKDIIEKENLWRLRNRLVTRHQFKYGHAFRAWQKRFLATKPEYFGLSPYGTRGLPRFQDHLVKLCLTNDAVIDQIIADWVKAGKGKYLNLCPNDGTPGYCFCENCRKLDADLPGERFHSHKTDRYLNFWNRVIAKAREIRPDVTAIVYIYSYYRFPPRREKIQFPDNTICGMVPQMTEAAGDIFEQWKKAGMKHCFFRPNYIHYRDVLPRGIDKFLYDSYNKAASFNFIGADYDAIPNRRPSDLEFYVLARILDEPDAKFEDIINEYCAAYGKASEAVKAYYARLRTRGEAALQATAKKMAAQNLSVLDDGELGKYAVSGHTEKDLIEDINVLKEGLKVKDLCPVAKKRLEELIISAEHYLHTFRFMRAGAVNKDLEKYAKILHDFRIANKDVLNENFGLIYSRKEKKFWNNVEFYNKDVKKNNYSPADPSAGWRASFDDPGLANWTARKGYVKITDSTASFDKYSVELAPQSAKDDTIGIWRRAVPVTPGKEYKLSFDFKFDGVTHGSIRIVTGGKVRKPLLRKVTKDNGKGFWISNEAKFKVPEGCDVIDIYVNVGKGTKDGAKAFVDNIVLTRQ